MALVTGGSRGIGAACARALALSGARVLINFFHDQSQAERVAEQINLEGGRAEIHRADLGNTQEVRSLFRKVNQDWGRLDILVQSAGFSQYPPTPVEYTTDEFFDEVINTHLKGTFRCLREAIALMQPGGRIIHFSSTGVDYPHSGYAAYTAAKAGVEIVTRSLARELKGKNVTVNCISPGATATDSWYEGKSEAVIRLIRESSPLERLGTPEDIAHLVSFLVLPEAEWINGQVIRANGGFF